MRAASIRTSSRRPRAIHHRRRPRRGGQAARPEPARPTRCSSRNAALGLGVLQELRARDLRPGRDLGLICFDDAPWAPFIDPPISVVSQPAYRMGAQAAALLVERIGGREPQRTAHRPGHRSHRARQLPKAEATEGDTGEGQQCADRWVFWGPFRPLDTHRFDRRSPVRSGRPSVHFLVPGGRRSGIRRFGRPDGGQASR